MRKRRRNSTISRAVEITIPTLPKVKIGTAHKFLPTLLQAVAAGCSPFLVGPAGSGKTTLCEQVAKALGRPFYMAARVTSEFKLVGFVDQHAWTPPFGYYDRDYPGIVPYSKEQSS